MAYDNACKYLAEEYPADFVNWLLSESEATDIQVIKTELGIEPIRADSLTFLQTANKILHIEFQTLPESNPPLSLRMLDYWVRLYRQYGCHIEQVVIFLKPTNSDTVFTEQFEETNTLHRYRVIRLWEQDPVPFLNNVGLLPLAALARTDSPQALLEQVAKQIARIESREKRQLLSGFVGVLAGLRFEKDLIKRLFTEEIMQESVIYQEILQKGLQRGLQQGRQEGRQEGEVGLILRQVTRRFGSVSPQLQERIQRLAIPQLEELGEALLDFSAMTDLVTWLEQLGD